MEKIPDKEYYKRDEIYLKEGKEFLLKEIYKEFKNIIKENFQNTEHIKLLDVGTASGEIPYYLKKELRIKEKIYAFDKSPELVKNAIERFGNGNIIFFVDDAQTFNLEKQFDIIIVSGVITIFDDYRPTINSVIKHLKKGGVAIISSFFNDDAIDVRIRFRTKGSKIWQTGYNFFILGEVIEYIKSFGCEVEVKEHIMPFDLKKQEDPIRGWTVMYDGKRELRNGLCLIYNLKQIIIKKL